MTADAPRGVLVVKLSSLGDVVHATGCLRAVRCQYPDAEIVVAVEARFAGLLRGHPDVDVLLEARETRSTAAAWLDARRVLRAAGSPRVDLAIDLQGRRKSAAWVYASGARRKAGRGGRRPGWSAVYHPDLTRHAVLVCADVARAAGIVVDDPSPRLCVSPTADARVERVLAERGLPAEGFLVVNPFSVWRAKEWPAERYAAAIDALCDRLDVATVITGGPEERERGAHLARRVARRGIVTLAGELRLEEALSVYRRAAVMLTGDSGPMHAAAALGTRVVALFGPTFPERAGPWGAGHVVLQASRPATHYAYREDHEDRHMAAIDVASVVDAVTYALRSERPRARVVGASVVAMPAAPRWVPSVDVPLPKPAFRTRVLYACRALGLYHHRARRSVWFHADGADDFGRMAAAIRDVRHDAPAHRIVLTSYSSATVAWLSRRYPNDFALPAPTRGGAVVRRFVRQLRPEVVVTLAHAREPAWLGHARRVGVEIVGLTAAGPPGEDVLARLTPVRVRDSADRAGRVPSRTEVIARSTPGRRLVRLHPGVRIDGLEALARYVRHPRTIFCLGNGPTCEDPRVAATQHDALFRVNWRWRERGPLRAPCVVFVGDHRSVWRVRSCAFAFRDDDFEREVRLASLARFRWRPFDSFVVAGSLPWVRDDRWPARPTNGALMVVTAAALRPARLVIAGIDLFAHPNGKYPGDAEAENAYAPVHDRDVDVAVIRRALDDYDGEVTIIGDALADALGHRDRAASGA